MDTIFMTSENSRTSEYHVLILNPILVGGGGKNYPPPPPPREKRKRKK